MCVPCCERDDGSGVEYCEFEYDEYGTAGYFVVAYRDCKSKSTLSLVWFGGRGGVGVEVEIRWFAC